MKRIVKVNDHEVLIEKTDPVHYEHIKELANAMSDIAADEDFNDILNAVAIFMSIILQAVQIPEEEGKDVLKNVFATVLSHAYNIGEERQIQ